MKPKCGCGLVLLYLGLSCEFAAAQSLAPKPPPQQNVSVIVVNAHADPAQPVPAVRVSLSYVDGSSRITDARDVTNPRGEALLMVSSDVAQRGDVRIEVTGSTNLAIYQPADGQLSTLPPSLTVKLLPRGSPALLGPAQIEALLHRTLLQVSSLQKQNQALRGQKPDLSAALNAIADAYGFSAADFDSRVQHWAQEVQADPAADARRRALAQIALKHFAEAEALFGQATHDDEAAMDADEQRFLEGRRAKLRLLLSDAQQTADAAQLSLKYHQATVTLESARDRAATEQKRFPDDKVMRILWLNAAFSVAGARRAEGEVAPAGESNALFAQATQDYQMLATEYAAAGERVRAAAAENNLGTVLSDEGERSSADRYAVMLDQAIAAYRRSLEVRTKADYPQDWAMTQVDIGSALLREGDRTPGAKGLALIDQAIEAYRRALEVYNPKDTPEPWAMTQNNLGLAFDHEGYRSSGPKAIALLEQAASAERSAAQVVTEKDSPNDWAMIQNNLGNALFHEGTRSAGDRSLALLEESIAAYRATLDVYTETGHPQGWARTQNNLGLSMMNEALRSTGERSATLFSQAIEAYRRALEVYTRADLPQDWARSQNNLGMALMNDGFRGGEGSSGKLTEAAQAFQNALEVRTRTGFPRDWATTSNNLASLDHDALFRFDPAFDLDRQLFDFDPSSDNALNLMEASLTAARFDVCLQTAGRVAAGLPAGGVLIRDLLVLAGAFGSGDRALARTTAASLTLQAPTLQKGLWIFTGTLHFLADAPAFASGRPTWIALFTAVQDGNPAAMTKALQDLAPLLQN